MRAKSSVLYALVFLAIVVTLAFLPTSFSSVQSSTFKVLRPKQASAGALSRRVSVARRGTDLEQSMEMAMQSDLEDLSLKPGKKKGQTKSSFKRTPGDPLRGLSYKQPVRQWAPIKIPPSQYRAPEDRVRFRMYAFHPMFIEEACEILTDLAKELGGDTEGPIVHKPKIKKYALNKSPNGHKKSKYKVDFPEHCWEFDFYPPVEGGLESLLKLRLPVQVTVEIL
mmetsp:Transcript_126092/g.251782  ORF Transcript_126092/g.251782 Transcript_126092/m.251782 type:complete len:224 (-) Transcript_126092:88-759(-)|eukprot:CAMPEP_0172715586 /NCGR_PEP_ID=MMETSP1074-20121228/67632_1 /TAXON_ID=2916 /ORGANISM="Ceratium fusus, Strain PA161109" /LENGTH=223 /DNA_ID=CAMNT_0013540179 /DNA_START=70 /DNA_END=741 /DNA_ORIENTATION=-